MDEDKYPCLKGFGFLPSEKKVKSGTRRHVGRKKSKRYFVGEYAGVYLTTRELEASQLMAHGYCIREAAEVMDLSPRTVEFYLGNVRRKLGVRNKSELLKVLYKNDFFQT